MNVTKVRAKLAKGKTKKKCCRSKPRCCTCPVVVKRLEKSGALDCGDKEFKKQLKKAREA